MYGQFFNLDESVFSIAPNPKYLFLSKQHEEALAHLLYGVTRKGGFVCLTGDIGTGKTTICRCMFEQLPENTDIAFVVNPKFSPMELLASICDELQLSYSTFHPSIKEYIKKLNAYLIEAHAKGRNTVLVIDEAQNLSVDALEHIRALTNLETNEQKLLQIILIGQPELKNLLSKPELEQVNQRITARFHIGPLNLNDTNQYINHRLLAAGAKHKIFTESNIKQIHELTKGVPRLINILCDRVLLGAYTLGTTKITSKIISQSASEVFGRTHSSSEVIPKALAASIFVFFIMSAAIIAYQNLQIDLSRVKEFTANVIAVPQQDGIEDTIENVADKKNEKPKVGSLITENSVTAISKGSKLLREEKITVSENVKQQIESNNKEITNIKEQPASFVEIENADDSTTKKLQSASPEITEQEEKLQLTSYGKAYKLLFRLWGVDYIPEKTNPCDHALNNGLQCYQGEESLNKIIRLNRPVLLRSKDQKFGPAYIVLISVEEKHAIVNEHGNYQLVAITEIESNWDGHFEMLWRPLQTGVPYIKPGYKGKAVAILDQELAKIQGREPSSNNPFEYSTELVNQVRAFQIANNIPSDGVVGPITQMYINNKRSDTPYLIK